MAITLTVLADVQSITVVADTLTTVPVSGGVRVPPNSSYNSLEMAITLSNALKLAVGNTLQIDAFLSMDNGSTWQFINGFLWNSYGPDGLTAIDPDGTVNINPGPRLFVPLNGVKGQLARLQYTAHGIPTLGVTIYGVG